MVESDGLIASRSRDEVELRELHIAGNVDPPASGPLVHQIRGGVTDWNTDTNHVIPGQTLTNSYRNQSLEDNAGGPLESLEGS